MLLFLGQSNPSRWLLYLSRHSSSLDYFISPVAVLVQHLAKILPNKVPQFRLRANQGNTYVFFVYWSKTNYCFRNDQFGTGEPVANLINNFNVERSQLSSYCQSWHWNSQSSKSLGSNCIKSVFTPSRLLLLVTIVDRMVIMVQLLRILFKTICSDASIVGC